jgi:hypothetical protein
VTTPCAQPHSASVWRDPHPVKNASGGSWHRVEASSCTRARDVSALASSATVRCVRPLAPSPRRSLERGAGLAVIRTSDRPPRRNAGLDRRLRTGLPQRASPGVPAQPLQQGFGLWPQMRPPAPRTRPPPSYVVRIYAARACAGLRVDVPHGDGGVGTVAAILSKRRRRGVRDKLRRVLRVRLYALSVHGGHPTRTRYSFIGCRGAARCGENSPPQAVAVVCCWRAKVKLGDGWPRSQQTGHRPPAPPALVFLGRQRGASKEGAACRALSARMCGRT